jgi:four helix bundle protein
MRETIRDFRDLIIWQKAMEFAKEVYRLSKCWPRDEQFGLTQQVCRAAVSVPSNIAEGHARQGREFPHFLSIARGSLAESECQLILAAELLYISHAELATAHQLAQEIRRMAVSLASKLTPDP